MAPPPATAELSAYDSANLYAALVEARSHCSNAYQECVSDAQTALDNGLYLCSQLPTYQMQTNCSGGMRGRFNTAVAACTTTYVCSPYDCDQDPVRPYSYRCCSSGQQACNGGCVPECPTVRHRILIDDTTCRCRCDPLLYDCSLIKPGEWVRDASSCLCRCATLHEAPCYAYGAVRDPATCSCICPPPTVLHNAECIDLTSDENNCGGFGVLCGQGEGCCHSQCVPLDTDDNCGRCDTNLDPFALLNPAKCCGGVPTSLGQPSSCSDCGDACPALGGCCRPDMAHTSYWCDPGPSTQHCGRCASAPVCHTGETCCYTYTHNPAMPTTGHKCANLQTSATACGACFNACYSGRVCTTGVCRCPTGKQPCGSTNVRGPQFCCDTAAGEKCCSNKCADTNNDPMNCGNCGVTCSGGKNCVNGQCVCPAPLSDCHGICVNLQTDNNNCGQCDIHCPAPKQCKMGQCVCPQGQIDCHNLGTCCPPDACCPNGCCTGGKKCCANTCVDTATDINHCGSCGGTCSPGHYTILATGERVDYPAFCAGGTCTCPPGHYRCGGTDPTAICSPVDHPACCPPTAGYPGWHTCTTSCGPNFCVPG